MPGKDRVEVLEGENIGHIKETHYYHRDPGPGYSHGVRIPSKGQVNLNTVLGAAGAASFLGFNLRNVFKGGHDGYGHGYNHGYGHGYNNNCNPCCNSGCNSGGNPCIQNNGCNQSVYGGYPGYPCGPYPGYPVYPGYPGYPGYGAYPGYGEYKGSCREEKLEDENCSLKACLAQGNAERFAECGDFKLYKEFCARLEENKDQSNCRENYLQEEICKLQARLSADEANISCLCKETEAGFKMLKMEMCSAMALESERRECGDRNIYEYVHGHYVPGHLVIQPKDICPQPWQPLHHNHHRHDTSGSTDGPQGA